MLSALLNFSSKFPIETYPLLIPLNIRADCSACGVMCYITLMSYAFPYQHDINFVRFLKGEVHSKMKVSYLVEFGTLSRMVKVRGACDKPFWVY